MGATGKDFDAAFIGLNLFLRCLKEGLTCRILNTSVAEHHLKVVWGEMSRFLTMQKEGGFAAVPLLHKDGGPLVVNYMEVRRASESAAKNPLNYLAGRVSERGEGMAGHHADVTLLIGDEASGLVKKVREMGQGWAKAMLWIGNCNPESGQGFFKEEIAKGDLLASDEPQLVET